MTLKTSIFLIIFVFITTFTSTVSAQTESNTPKLNFSNGIGITAPDSSFSLNFRFRTQLRAGYNTVSTNNLSASDIEARVRRMRLRFEGFVFNPKINYYVQLSFSRGDMDWNSNDVSLNNTSPNLVRDAIVIYNPTKKLTLIFGQTKLPGNRQRVVSSGSLQFADRSIVNATFTPDRDFGLQLEYTNNIAKIEYVLKGAISSGEGRNAISSDAGLAYTGRIEILPLGNFTNKGDYFEGDLEREKKPKLSLAGGYHYNENAVRTEGTLGNDLYQNRNLSSFIADLLFKYRGFAFTTEYLNRNTKAPITNNGTGLERHVYVGEGKMVQLSYLFKNNFEVAGRYAIISPYSTIYHKEFQKQEVGIGVTKYLRDHKVKLQGLLFYNQDDNLLINSVNKKYFNALFQIELGI